MLALLLGAVAAEAQSPPVLTLSNVSIQNHASPAVGELTAGYAALVRFDAEWTGGFRNRTGLEILIDGTSVLNETLEFRNRLGEFQTQFSRQIILPTNLSGDARTLTVRCYAIAQMRGGSVPPITSTPFQLKFSVAGGGDTPASSETPAAPDPANLELRFLNFAKAVAQRAESHYRVTLPPVSPRDNRSGQRLELWAQYVSGYQDGGLIDPAKGGLRVSLSGQFHPEPVSGHRPTHSRSENIDSFFPEGWMRKSQTFFSDDISPGYLLISLQVRGQTSPSTGIKTTRQQLSVMWFLGDDTQDYLSLSIGRAEPVPELTTALAGRLVEDLKLEVQQIATLFVDSANHTGYLSAKWSGPVPVSKQTPLPPATPPGSSISIPGVRRPPTAEPDQPQTLAARLQQLGEQSAARAEAIVAQAIPSAEGLTPAETSLLAEAALTGEDPQTLIAELAEEEVALGATASGDGLRVVSVRHTPSRPNPGDEIDVTVTVRNTSTTGGPASFDLSLDDYHNGNRPVATLKRRTLPPGQSASYSLQFTAPRDYAFGGYATVDPLVFSGNELPFQVLNITINWDGTTMTDEEIIAELRDRNPCPDEFPLTSERLAHFVPLYRTDRLAALGALEREAIEAQRQIQQADYLARLHDPDFQQQLQDDLDAAANTKQLAAYYSLRQLAQKWGYIHHLDLVAILDDAVFIDSNAKVHGNVALARRRIHRAIEDKQAAPGAVQSLLLADPGDNAGPTAAYRQMEPIMTPALTAVGLADLGEATSQAIVTRSLAEVHSAYQKLTTLSQNSGTSVLTFQLEREQFRSALAKATQQLKTVDSAQARAVIAKATANLDKLDRIAAQATAFQEKAKAYEKTKGVNGRVGKTISTVGHLWTVYEISEKVLVRTNAGEDFVTALGKESGNWGAKTLINSVPVIAAADTVMSATGQLLKKLGPEYWERENIDPTQYNASTLVDLGTSLTFAGVEDMSYTFGRRYDREPPLTPAERNQLEARLAAFEQRLDQTQDDALRQRLLTARANVRQVLRDRR